MGFSKLFNATIGASAILRTAVLLLVLFAVLPAMAQTVSGTVTTLDGEEVIGATVMVKKTTNGTSTDISGNYSLNGVPANSTLVFSYVGFETVEVPVNGRSVIDVKMKESGIELDEVVAIGYGTVKKADLTGAVSVVKPEDYKSKTNNSIGDLLQGAAAGVSVRSGGEIGSLPSIQIRGTGNLTNNDPLYVIDGMPSSNDVHFNVNDIESIQVLKDASAAAIYGSRAANGVIIITTKRGQEGRTRFNFSAQVAIQDLPRIKYAGAEEWKALYDAAFDNAMALGIEGVTSRMDHWDNDTDWQDAFFKTGVMQSYDLSMSGGSQHGTYRASINYMDNTGTTIGRHMSRLTGRINSNGKLGIVSFGENLSVSRTKISNSGGGINDVTGMIPTIPIYDDSEFATTHGFGRGNLTNARALGNNPIALVNNGGGLNEYLFVRGVVWGEVQIFPFLKYKINLGADISDSNNSSWSKGYACALNMSDNSSSATSSWRRRYNYVVENTLTFNKKFHGHSLDVLVGNTYQKTTEKTASAGQKNLIQTAGGNFLHTVSSGTSEPSASGFNYSAALISYLGRINYDYKGRYLLSLTGRIDGSSRFGSGHRWGTFPSASVAWRISQEKFFKADWVNDLKLRANWGKLGSQNVGYYDYQMYVNSYAQYLFNGDGQGATNGQTVVKLSNQDLSWETMEQKNFGVDMSFLNNRLSLTAEYYISTSHDVLTSLQLLMTTGNGGGNPYVNAASIENKGFEVTATWRDRPTQDFSYSVSLNFSHSDNKLLKFGYGKLEQYTDKTTTRVGEPIGMFYLLKTDGIFQSQEEVNSYVNSKGTPIQPEAGPGDIRYVDANGDGVINSDDRVVCGSPWPKLEFGINLQATYKNFDLGVIGYGKLGCTTYNETSRVVGNLADCKGAYAGYDYWSPTNTGSKNPRPIYGDMRNSYTYSDRWLEDSSFFRLSSVSIGWNWKPSWLKGYVDNIRLSFTAQNLLTITSYKGYDPDYNSSLFEPGVDYIYYPSPKSYIFGLNLNF